MMFLADPPWQQGGWGGGSCFLIALLILGGLIAGWAIWRRKKGPGKGSDDAAAKRSAAEETLAERYARGDLTEEEYWEKLSVVREAQSR